MAAATTPPGFDEARDLLVETARVVTEISRRQATTSPILLNLICWVSALAELRAMGFVSDADLLHLESAWLSLAHYLDGLSAGNPAPGKVYTEACRIVTTSCLKDDCSRLSEAIRNWLRRWASAHIH